MYIILSEQVTKLQFCCSIANALYGYAMCEALCWNTIKAGRHHVEIKDYFVDNTE